HNEAYTWTNPTCCVHNIIVGKLWIEQYGNVEITNHKTGEKCVLSFKPCGLFGKELHKVEGYIQDKSKKKLCALYGKWTECLYSVDPATFEAYKKNDKKNAEEKKSSKQVSNAEEPDEMPLPDSESVYVIPGSILLWKITPRPPNSAQMYNFTSFAMALNELDKEMESVIPKTDCRLRPDIRAMENGEIALEPLLRSVVQPYSWRLRGESWSIKSIRELVTFCFHQPKQKEYFEVTILSHAVKAT
ncbi:hypothetical protein CIB84_012770, partial [Bambusicola thoracicus]